MTVNGLPMNPQAGNSFLKLPPELLTDCIFSSGNPVVFAACKSLHLYRDEFYKKVETLYFRQDLIRQLFVMESTQDAVLAIPYISSIFRRIIKEADIHNILREISPTAQHQSASVIEEWSTLILFDRITDYIPSAEDFFLKGIDDFNLCMQSSPKQEKHLRIDEKALSVDRWMKENRHQLEGLRSIQISYEMPVVPRHIAYLTGLRELDLSGCKIMYLMNEIGSLVHLEKIDLSRNHLSTLPFSFRFLNNLQELRLKMNRFKVLPRTLCYLREIRVLDVSRNKLKKLPMWLPIMQRLHYLDFSYNAFSEFPSRLSLLRELSILKASHNSLGSIPACIHMYRALEHFDISDNPFQNNLPSMGLKVLATDYNLHFLKLNSDQMKLLNPDVCCYLQSRGILPQYHLTRSPATDNLNSAWNVFQYVQHILFSE